MVDVKSPDAERIDAVADNLNTHHSYFMPEFFGKQEANRIMSNLGLHYTPEHASWLILAETELSTLSQKRMSRPLPSQWDLTTEIVAWEEAPNEKQAKILSNFTVDNARKVFREQYRRF